MELDAAVLLLALAEIGNQGLLRRHAFSDHAVRGDALVHEVPGDRLGLRIRERLGLGRIERAIPMRLHVKLADFGMVHEDVHHFVKKADVLRRWPGGLIEYYGMTEGGGSCILPAHLHPDKLHTVGQPAEGHDIRLIDEQGRELPRGQTGEVVGGATSAPATSAASTTTAF